MLQKLSRMPHISLLVNFDSFRTSPAFFTPVNLSCNNFMPMEIKHLLADSRRKLFYLQEFLRFFIKKKPPEMADFFCLGILKMPYSQVGQKVKP